MCQHHTNKPERDNTLGIVVFCDRLLSRAERLAHGIHCKVMCPRPTPLRNFHVVLHSLPFPLSNQGVRIFFSCRCLSRTPGDERHRVRCHRQSLVPYRALQAAPHATRRSTMYGCYRYPLVERVSMMARGDSKFAILKLAIAFSTLATLYFGLIRRRP